MRLGWHRLAWSLRRLHCPVHPNDLVLEVGSGGNPYYRSNVLLDAFLDPEERHGAPLVTDRKTIIGLVEKLPFKDDSFDFVIAAHVLEHSKNPALFLSELQRVAKSGYIEIPDAFFERINPYIDHKSEIRLRGDKLIIREKHKWDEDEQLVELYEHRAKSVITRSAMRKYPFEFNIRFYWQDQIPFEIENGNVEFYDTSRSAYSHNESLGSSMSKKIRMTIRKWLVTALSQRKRNTQLDLIGIFQCPHCLCGDLQDQIECLGCGNRYDVQGDMVLFDDGKKNISDS
jgi:hypothetical protein